MTFRSWDRRAWVVALTVAGVVLAATLGAAAAAPSTAAAQAEPDEYRVLFFHRTTGFRHGSIPDAIEAVQELGAEHGFAVTETQDPTVFNDATLREYAAVVFFTDGENTLNHAQRTAFERYLHRGGGFVGLHSTSNMDKAGWSWWEDLLGGAFFDNHPPIQAATMHVEDATHPATSHLPAEWQWTDEWYNFTADPRDRNVHVVLSVDESTYSGGQMGEGHPIAWCSNYDGGRTFYTAIGHQSSHYDDGLFRGHILGAIEWAAGVAEGNCGDPREGPPTEAAFEKVALDDNTANPMKLDVAPDGRVFYTELGGDLKIWHPDTQAVTIAGEIDVARVHENGLIGVALDPDFAQNNWVYLFYTDPAQRTVDGTTGGVQHISRFTLDPATETLDLASEVVLLEIPHQRQECCHTAGHLEFDSQGNLYASTGDDTNPFASDGYGPFDYRSGRAPWDAARSSSNTADLRGKILRINPLETATPSDQPGLGRTYTVPGDNLFTATNNTYHHLFPGGVYDPALARPEIYTMGHRNPFTIAIDPATDALWIGQVGPDGNPSGGFNPNRGPRGYDFWTQVREAGNYGWPFCVVANEPYRQWNFATQTPGQFYDCQGGPVNDSPRNTGLSRLPPVEQLPTIYYPYCNGQGGYSAPVPFPEVPCGPVPGGNGYGTGRAAYAGDVYRFDPELEADGKFPAYFDGKPFLVEWERDLLSSISLDSSGAYVPDSFEEFGFRWRFDNSLRFRKPHDLEFGPDGNLYLIEWGEDFNFGGGAVNPDSGLYRISYVKGGRTPRARAAATPDNGQPPLEVSFSSAGTVDPDGEEITYQWNLGDGTTSTEPNPTHVYAEAGVYQAQLTVTDPTGRSSSSAVTITVGNTRPQVRIDLPPQGRLFDWGDEIPYRVSVTDAEDGSTSNGGIDCDDVTVQRGLWHRSGEAPHVHPEGSQTGCAGTIATEADAAHGEGADVAVVLTASYTDRGDDPDAQPLTGGVSHLLQPAHKEAEHFTESSSAIVVSPIEGGGEAIRGADGAWASFEPINLEGVDEVTLRAAALADTEVELRRGAPDGQLLATAAIPQTLEIGRVPGRPGYGNAVRLNGPSPNEYVDMPDGILGSLTDFTIATWVNRTSTGGQTWSRLWDFGTGTAVHMFLTVDAGGAAGARVAITLGGGGGEQQVTAASPIPTGWHHVAVTRTGTTVRLWVDGNQVAANGNVTLSPSSLGSTTNNWIGRSQYGADPPLQAEVDDFNIFDRGLSQTELQALMAAPGGGNVASYQFDEPSGARVVDASGRGNDGTIVLDDDVAIPFTDVTVDLPPSRGSAPLYLVFPQREALIDWLDFDAPFVSAWAEPTEGIAPLRVKHHAESTVPGVTFRWDFGDGRPGSSLQNPTHTYARAGTYTATVTATRPNGDTSTSSVEIRVRPYCRPTC